MISCLFARQMAEVLELIGSIPSMEESKSNVFYFKIIKQSGIINKLLLKF